MPAPFSKTLGHTTIPVSPIGLGLAALGRPGYINLGHAGDLGGHYDVSAMRARAWGVLDEAYKLGVRYFDAARSYGSAEAFLGAWLRERGLGAAEVTVGSKWGYTYTAGWQVQAEQHEVKEHSAANLTRQWPQTRELLGPWLRLYMVHSFTPDSPLLEDEKALEQLAALAAEGVCVGLSLSGPQQATALERALEARVSGQQVFGAVQATWNLLEPSVGPALQEAWRQGWGVIVKEAVANGRLTSRGADARHPALQAACQHSGASPDQVALAAALAQPFADMVLSGAATTEQLHSNLGALELNLDEATLEALGVLRQSPQSYWASRAQLEWN